MEWIALNLGGNPIQQFNLDTATGIALQTYGIELICRVKQSVIEVTTLVRLSAKFDKLAETWQTTQECRRCATRSDRGVTASTDRSESGGYSVGTLANRGGCR